MHQAQYLRGEEIGTQHRRLKVILKITIRKRCLIQSVPLVILHRARKFVMHYFHPIFKVTLPVGVGDRFSQMISVNILEVFDGEEALDEAVADTVFAPQPDIASSPLKDKRLEIERINDIRRMFPIHKRNEISQKTNEVQTP